MSRRRLPLLLLAAGMSLAALPPLRPPAVAAQTRGGEAVALTLRRSMTGVEVVIEGAGDSPILQQSFQAGSWQGLLRLQQPGGLRLGPQRITLPEAGIQRVSLQGAGQDYRIDVVPVAGIPLRRPVVSADGRNLIVAFPLDREVIGQIMRPNLTQPAAIPQPSMAPPLQPRAVAPPLGDMAVGSMVLRNRSFLNLSGPAVSMTMRNAPARDVLMALAQMGGYGFVYVDDAAEQPASAGATAQTNAATRPVSIAFQGESYAKAFNAVLLSAGLQGRLEGRMILAGPSVHGKTLGTQLSKVYRLNQASAASAADYLASLGAQITKVTVITNTVSQGQTQANQVAGAPSTQQTKTERITTTETYGAMAGPLKGLTGTTDSRLQTITLVGDPQVVSVAENYLRQIDLRQRQVALSVRILDVSLSNDSSISNSFAFRYGNNFIVNDDGSFAGAWGRFLPPSSRLAVDAAVGPVANPGMQYPKNEFFDLLRASIESQSTKLLASPTLIISENSEQISGGASVVPGASSDAGGAAAQAFQAASIGRERANESFVTVGTQVITDYEVTTGTQGNGNSCEPQFSTAGLTFGARVTRIDDNGFVTFNLSPAVSAITDQQSVEGCGLINILSVRRLDTGSVRVRDGQTLILTGVISDFNSQGVNKIPLLGDLPLIGQFFRSSTGSRSKNELVILVTPRIINDTDGGVYGYGYQPASQQSRQFLGGSIGPSAD